MKRFFLIAALSLNCFAYCNFLEFLLPEGLGDMEKVGLEPIETSHKKIVSGTGNTTITFYYKNGSVITYISASKNVCHCCSEMYQPPAQWIHIDAEYNERGICTGEKTSRSSSVILQDPETIVHVHDDFLVYTTKDSQRIVPRF